jgi:hypothetical protein
MIRCCLELAVCPFRWLIYNIVKKEATDKKRKKVRVILEGAMKETTR